MYCLYGWSKRGCFRNGSLEKVGKEQLRIGIIGQFLLDRLADSGSAEVGFVAGFLRRPCFGGLLISKLVDDKHAVHVIHRLAHNKAINQSTDMRTEDRRGGKEGVHQ